MDETTRPIDGGAPTEPPAEVPDDVVVPSTEAPSHAPTQPMAQGAPMPTPPLLVGWAPPPPPYAPGNPMPFAPVPHAYAAPKSSRPALVLSIISLVVAVVSLLGMLLMAAAMFGGGSVGPLTGTVPSVTPGSALTGEALASAVSSRIEDDGGQVDAMTCPETPKVEQGVVTVCHGGIDGGDWAVIVFFEDATGKYTLDPL